MELKPENGKATPARLPDFKDGGSDGEIDLTLRLSIGRRKRRPSAASPIGTSGEAPNDAASLAPRGVRLEGRTEMEAMMLESRARDRAARVAEEYGGCERAAVVSQVMCPYRTEQQVQYVPVANDFGFAYLVPCRAATMSAASGGCGVGIANQSVAFGLFPIQVPTMCAGGGYIVPPTDASGECVVQPLQSPGSITSGISDHRSVSLLGENASSSGSIDSMRSPSSHLTRKKPAAAQPRRQLSKRENESSLTPESVLTCNKFRSASAVKEAKPCAVVSDVKNKSTIGSGKAASTEAPHNLSSSRMPRVSTTGRGLNGRTVTGFLYKYDSSGVIIVCDCHRTTFTPAEFVRHAGGVNLDHPLKHIVVASPATSSS